jgi:hypothetical protein
MAGEESSGGDAKICNGFVKGAFLRFSCKWAVFTSGLLTYTVK